MSDSRRRSSWLAGLAGLIGLTLTACGSLPHIVPDLARRPAGTARVQLVGTGGPLPAAQRQAVLARLQEGVIELSQWRRRARGHRVQEAFARLWEYWL